MKYLPRILLLIAISIIELIALLGLYSFFVIDTTNVFSDGGIAFVLIMLGVFVLGGGSWVFHLKKLRGNKRLTPDTSESFDLLDIDIALNQSNEGPGKLSIWLKVANILYGVLSIVACVLLFFILDDLPPLTSFRDLIPYAVIFSFLFSGPSILIGALIFHIRNG